MKHYQTSGEAAPAGVHAFREESEMMSMTDITAGHINSVYSKKFDQTERDGAQ